ncbi:MAG: hypothetical protein AAGG11_24920 [Pseudomonadota bacterium]
MHTIADRWLELAEKNYLIDSVEPGGWAVDPAEAGRAAAWAVVTERHAPSGLAFRW